VHQFGLFQNTLRNPNQFAETLARLGALVGSENVGTPVPEAMHRPDVFQVQPPNFEFVPVRSTPAGSPGEGLQLRRFRPPLPARVEFRENKPSHVRCEHFTGPITGLQGPYLSSGNWWDESQWSREEWDVEITGGRLLRLFRSGDACFVEGVYD
jgi:protein ImuB